MKLAAILAVAAMFLPGCATQEKSWRTRVLSLPFKEFDQAYGDGWRSVYERGQSLAAVSLIEAYLKRHPQLSFAQRKFLHLHAAQILALENQNYRAIKHLDEAASDQETAGLWPDWNDFIAATKAFLSHDRPSLLAAYERLAAANAPRQKYAGRLLENFGRSYSDVIWWIRVSPLVATSQDASPAERSTAAKLAIAIGGSVTTNVSNSPSCCIWLELRSFTPTGTPKGYVIIHSADGTVITASDPQWLDSAVDRFIKTSRQVHGNWEAPFGVASNYDPTSRVPPGR